MKFPRTARFIEGFSVTVSVTVSATVSEAAIGSSFNVVDEDVESDSTSLTVDFEGDPHPNIHNKGIVANSLIIEF